jgi:UDP-GlcNAc:undecaprenyl-phosphate/decaprenyl-phosphate GlcNAc-1-phosphate transferase
MAILIAFFAGLVGVLLLTPLSMALAHRIGAIDRPGDLTVHEQATPRFGGSAIWAATVLACGVGLFLIGPGADRGGLGVVLAGATLMALIGAVDDATGVSPRVRLGLGLAIAAGTAVGIVGISHGFGITQILLVCAFVLWLLGSANATNMLDGLDGLAAGVAGIAAVGIAVVAIAAGNLTCAIMSLSLAGASLGFLAYNFKPARTFMGDVGSLFLGFMLASSVLLLFRGTQDISGLPYILGAMVALGMPIGDMLLAIVRRLLNHKPIFQGDRSHFYDQLRDRFGFGVVKTVLTCYILAAVFFALATLTASFDWLHALVSTIVVIVVAALATLAGGFLHREGAHT